MTKHCTGCSMDLEDDPHDPVVDGNYDDWHRDCLRQYRIAKLAEPRTVGQCAGCGNVITTDHPYRPQGGSFYHQLCWAKEMKYEHQYLGSCGHCHIEVLGSKEHIWYKTRVYHLQCHKQASEMQKNLGICHACSKVVIASEPHIKNKNAVFHEGHYINVVDMLAKKVKCTYCTKPITDDTRYWSMCDGKFAHFKCWVERS